jgi:hypothetical protein
MNTLPEKRAMLLVAIGQKEHGEKTYFNVLSHMESQARYPLP